MGCSNTKQISISAESAKEIVKETNELIKNQGGTTLHFTKLQVKHIAEIFKNRGNGESLGRADFKTFFNIDEDSMDILFEAFDTDHSGSLELPEMIAGFSFLCRGTIQEKLRFLFVQYDSDNSGFLEHSEIMPLFEKLTTQLIKLEKAHLARIPGENHKEKMRSSRGKEAQHVIENCERMSKELDLLAENFTTQADLDGDGKINFEEFADFMESSSLCKSFLDMLTTTSDILRKDEGNFA